MHTHAPTHVPHTCTQSWAHSHAHTFTDRHTQTHINQLTHLGPYIHASTYDHIVAHNHDHTHMHTHLQSHTDTLANSHTYGHTQRQVCACTLINTLTYSSPYSYSHTLSHIHAQLPLTQMLQCRGCPCLPSRDLGGSPHHLSLLDLCPWLMHPVLLRAMFPNDPQSSLPASDLYSSDYGCSVQPPLLPLSTQDPSLSHPLNPAWSSFLLLFQGPLGTPPRSLPRPPPANPPGFHEAPIPALLTAFRKGEGPDSI